MRCARQGAVRTDMRIVVLIVLVFLLAVFGLFLLYPNPHKQTYSRATRLSGPRSECEPMPTACHTLPPEMQSKCTYGE